MAKCTECGSTMTKTTGDHVYRESGLDNVILRNIAKLECPKCGAKSVEIPQMAKLHNAIAAALAEKPARLEPPEVRFLRDHLELSNVQFADLMGVSPAQSSRWTTTDAIGQQAERLLRMLAVLGPDRVKPTGDLTINEDAVGVARAGLAEETLGEMMKVIKQLPSVSDEVKPVKFGMRKSGTGWKPDAMTN